MLLAGSGGGRHMWPMQAIKVHGRMRLVEMYYLIMIGTWYNIMGVPMM